MSAPVLSRLWIAAAERALDAELDAVRPERVAEVRSQLRVAAIAAEDLMNVVAGPRGAARSTAIATLVERFGDHAIDVDFMAAAFIGDAVAATLAEIGVAAAEVDRVASRCRTAVHEAAAALETLVAVARC